MGLLFVWWGRAVRKHLPIPESGFSMPLARQARNAYFSSSVSNELKYSAS